MSLIYKRLSTLANQAVLATDFRIPALTGAGLQNLSLGAMQTFINQPLVSRIDALESSTGPSIWPAKRRVTLTGGATGSVQLDGSADVSLAATVNSSGITYTANTVPMTSINGLETRLASIEEDIVAIGGGGGGIIAPFNIQQPNPGGATFLNMKATNGTVIGSLGATTSYVQLSTEGAQVSRLRYGSGGTLQAINDAGLVQHTFWNSATFNPSTYNAPTATKLATSRTVTFNGPYAGQFTYDGSQNAALSLSLRAYGTASTSNTDSGSWARIARLTAAAQYGDCAIALYLMGSSDGGTGLRQTRLRARIKQQSAPPAQPYVNLEIERSSYLTVGDVALVINDPTAFPVTADLYIRINGTFSAMRYLVEGQSGSNLPEFLSSEALVAALPATGTTIYNGTTASDTAWAKSFVASDDMKVGNNLVWHAGTFNPANYSQTSHKHDGADITTGDINPQRVKGLRIVQNQGVAVAPGNLDNSFQIFQRDLSDQGLSGNGSATVLSLTPGSSASTWPDHQLTFNSNGGVYRRQGTRAGGWSPQYRLFDEGWFDPNSPVPTTGVLRVGASDAASARFDRNGNLSVNGGAFTKILTEGAFSPASYVTVTQSAGAYANADALNGKLAYAVCGATALGTPAAYMTTWNLGDNGNRDGQFSWSYGTSVRLFFRNRNDYSGAWQGWQELWHTGNFNPATYPANLPARLGASCQTVADWNAATSNGWYMASDAANAPIGGWLLGTITVHNADWIQQEVFTFTSGPEVMRYRRHKNGGTWTAWTTDVTHGMVNANMINLGYNPGTNNSIGCSNWFRALGETGLYFASYGGGWYMRDSTYVRAYNEKAVAGSWFETTGGHAPNTSADAAGFRTSGNYGGGFSMKDGGSHLSIYSIGGAMTFGFGVGSIQASRFQMQTDGLMLAGDYGLISDLREKYFVEPFEYRGRLSPIQFQWKDGRPDFGFGAQTVMRRYPDAVTYDGHTDTYRLKQSKLVAVVSAQANLIEDDLAREKVKVAALEVELLATQEKLARVMAHLGLTDI